jgi:hypothetical protein
MFTISLSLFNIVYSNINILLPVATHGHKPSILYVTGTASSGRCATAPASGARRSGGELDVHRSSARGGAPMVGVRSKDRSAATSSIGAREGATRRQRPRPRTSPCSIGALLNWTRGLPRRLGRRPLHCTHVRRRRAGPWLSPPPPGAGVCVHDLGAYVTDKVPNAMPRSHGTRPPWNVRHERPAVQTLVLTILLLED